ncbi:MAG: prolyl oligopeptidase family serine peptidase [Gaiellaceae bacterium]
MTAALWEQRFRAPVSYLPEWSPEAPDRAVVASNESGTWQLHAWDLLTDTRRQVTDHPVGLLDGTPTLDGARILWFQDDTGDESGRWQVQSFDGGEAREFLEGVPHGWNEGLAQAPGIVAAAISDRDGFAVYVAREGEQAREIARSAQSLRIGGAEEGGFLRGGLSVDGSLLCLEHAEHGDLIHTALRVLDARTGATVGELLDEGMLLVSRCWSPVAGDQRLALDHERAGEERPALWNLEIGERHDLAVDLEGAVLVQDWWPDGSALLLQNRFQGRDRLHRYELATGTLEPISTDPGVIWKARVRPDGRVWFLHEQGHRQRLVLDDAGVEVLAPKNRPALRAHGYESWQFENEHGQQVHGFVVTPRDHDGPCPVMMFVHGGPTWLDLDRWQPEVQAYVDAGFAIGLVNYRGSIGYGREWRDSLIGDIGGPELEDVNAGLRDLVERGIADPARAVIAGYSWGGYVSLLELGKHPDLWICGVAGVPVGDYEDGYEELSPLLQEYDRALLGRHEPKDVPELMRDRNPINFADQVRAPVLFLIGKNDSRCPYRQAMRYVERLAAREHPHEVYVYETGHSSFDVDERIRQVGTILDFLARHVPGVARPD